MPIDKDSMDFLTPVLDFTKASNIMPQQQNVPYQYYQQTPQFKRMMNSGSIQPNSKATKRSVSETKKKFIYLILLLEMELKLKGLIFQLMTSKRFQRH